MQVARDELRSDIVQLRKVGCRPEEGFVGLCSFQIADVLTDENIRGHAERDGILQMRAQGKGNH